MVKELQDLIMTRELIFLPNCKGSFEGQYFGEVEDSVFALENKWERRTGKDRSTLANPCGSAGCLQAYD